MVVLLAGAADLLEAQNLGFIARQDYGIDNAGALAIGDFNGDGIPDLVTGEISPDSAMCVFFGNADGTFTSGPCSSTANVAPESCAVADLNGDGNLDLVFSNSNSSDVYVMIGNGDGTFQTPLPVELPSNPSGLEYAIAVADFNGDGKLDMAVAVAPSGIVQSPQGVVVLLGSGDGTFGPPTTYSLGFGTSAVTATHLGTSSNWDLAAATSGGVGVLLGAGDGTFTTLPVIPLAKGAFSITSGDYNRDGNTDLAATLMDGAAYVAVLLGNGNGTFAPPAYHHCDAGASIATGDINGDGFLDLVTATPGGASILFGNGKGNFAPQVVYPVGADAQTVALADLRGNRNLDIATANPSGESLSVLLNEGKGKFQDGIQIPVSTGAYAVVEGHFDGDGELDAAVVGATGVQILLGTGKPTKPFTTGASYNLTDCYSVAAGDFNGDGIPDLAVGMYTGITILLGIGNGTFQIGGTFPASSSGGPGLGGLVATDVNLDGKLDIVTAGGTVLLGKGDGTFRPYYTVYVGGVSVAEGDFNGDGKPDLAFGYYGAPTGIAVLLGNGNGTFQPPQDYTLQVGAPVNSMLAADLNGDGRLDLVASWEGGVYLLFGNGNGTFQAAQTITEQFWIPSSIAVGDYNGDGMLDLAVANGSDYSVTILTGNGAGVFTYAGELGTDPSPGMVVGSHNLLTANGTTVSALSNLNKKAAPAGEF